MVRSFYYLQRLIVLFSLALYCTAYHSCVSVDKSFPFSFDNHVSTFSKGCTLRLRDTFTISVILISEGHSAQVTLTNTMKDEDPVILKVLRKDERTFEVTKDDKIIQHDIANSQETVTLSIRRGILSITFEPHTTMDLGKLEDYLYLLTIETNALHKTFLHHQQPVLRMLDQCPVGTFLVGQTCLRVCPVNHFGQDGICYKCSGSCSRCLSNDRCNPCEENQAYSAESNSCVEKCPDYYFEDFNNRVCVRCMDGCKTCSFPNGLCTLNYFKTDMIINLVISGVLFVLIVICACLCNKERPEDELNGQNQQPKQAAEGESENLKPLGKGKPKKFLDAAEKGPYNVLNEENEEETEEPSDNTAPRLSDYAKVKLLSISLARKPFVVDDGNDEKAVSHDSASKVFPKATSISAFPSRNEISPMLFNKGGIDAFKLGQHNASGYGTPEHKRSIEELTNKARAEPSSPMSQLLAKKETSLGLYARKVEDLEGDKNFSPFFIPREEEEEEERQKKEGYRSDASHGSVSKDQEGIMNYSSCTLCGMNKRGLHEQAMWTCCGLSCMHETV